MKKVIICVLILMMTICLVSCGGEKKEATIWNEQLIKDGVIKIGISPDYPPMENLDPDTGEMVGFDIDMIECLFGSLEGYEVELVKIDFDNIVTSLQQGQIDIGVSGFTYDEERDVIFSEPYLESAQVVLTKKDSGINSLSDLTGKKIGAQLGTTGQKEAEKIEGAEVVGFADATIGMQSVISGNIDCMILDIAVANAFAKENGLKVLDEKVIDENCYIIIKKGNDLLAEKINELIKEFKNSEDYDVVKNTWGLN